MIFSSKTRWFIAMLVATALIFSFASCSSDSDDDDDDSSSSSSSSAPSASALAGKMFTTIASVSSYAEVAANDDIILAFNSSGTGGTHYEYDSETSAWKSYSFSYNNSTGEVSFGNTVEIALVSLSDGYYFFIIDSPLGSDLSTVLTKLLGKTVTASGGKITYNGVQVGSYTESGNVVSVTLTGVSGTGYLAKYSGQYYELDMQLYSYSGSLPSVN